MNKNADLNMIEILIIISKNKKLFFWILGIVSIGIVAFTLIVDQKWTSTTITQPLTSSSGINLSNISGSFLSGLTGGLTGSEAAEGQRLVAIIFSRPFLEKLIKDFDLIKYYKIKVSKKQGYDTERDLCIKQIKKSLLSVSYNPEINLLYISVETKDKFLSAKIANYVVSELDRYNKTERLTKAKESRQLLEKRINEINSEVDILKEEIKNFQSQHNVLDLEQQTKAIVESYTSLESDRIKKEIELDLLKINFDQNDSRLSSKNDEIQQIKKAIAKIESSSGNAKYFLTLDNVSDLYKKYYTYETKIKIFEKVMEYIYPQYELSKLEESKEATTLQIIEEAVPAGIRSWPKRALLCIIVFMLSFVSLILLVIFKYKLEIYMEDPSIKEKITIIKENAFKK